MENENCNDEIKLNIDETSAQDKTSAITESKETDDIGMVAEHNEEVIEANTAEETMDVITSNEEETGNKITNKSSNENAQILNDMAAENVGVSIFIIINLITMAINNELITFFENIV